MGLDIIYGVVWYLIGQGSPPGGEGKLCIKKTMRKTTGNHLALFFPTHDTDSAINYEQRTYN